MKDERITVGNALKRGDLFTRLSAVIMGAGMLGHRQIIKGVLVFLFEILFWFYVLSMNLNHIAHQFERKETDTYGNDNIECTPVSL